MKIGILTYHRAENYGALLQAYALRTFLRQSGDDVSFIDYWPEYHVEHYRLFSWKRFRHYNIKGKLNYLFTFIIWLLPRYLRKTRLQHFMYSRLGLSSKIQYTKDEDVTCPYDVAVYGSDQIWRRQDIHGNQYNFWYFGSPNVKAKDKITYAASMGVIDATAHECSLIKEHLRAFSAISVRERNLQSFLTDLGFSSCLVSDPVFLLSQKEWRKLFRQRACNEKYIFFYNLLQTPESVQFADALSKETGLPVKEINMHLQWDHIFSRRYYACASIETFLRMLSDATYVVSNSFHGVAFSLLFEKQFFAVGMRERAQRVVSLLQSAQIEERYIQGEPLQAIQMPPIDYRLVAPKLLELENASKHYLHYSIRQ